MKVRDGVWPHGQVFKLVAFLQRLNLNAYIVMVGSGRVMIKWSVESDGSLIPSYKDKV